MDYDVKGLDAKIVKEAIMASGKTTTEYGRFAYNFLYSDESFFRYARKTILNANKLGKNVPDLYNSLKSMANFNNWKVNIKNQLATRFQYVFSPADTTRILNRLERNISIFSNQNVIEQLYSINRHIYIPNDILQAGKDNSGKYKIDTSYVANITMGTDELLNLLGYSDNTIKQFKSRMLIYS